MAKERSIRIGGINIRVHTQHAAAEYVALWTALHKLRRARTRGSTAIMIGDVRRLGQGADAPMYGYLYRFVDIDPDDPWFNIEEHKKAEAEDVAQVNIPRKLKPNLQEFPYLFDIKRHRVYFKTGGHGGGISAGMVTALIQDLVEIPKISDRFGEVDVTTLTKKGAVDALLKWPEIRRIHVVLERPNPSDFDDEKNFYDRLKRRSIKREEISYVKAKGAASITPDAEMQKIFKVAEENGVYKQVGVTAEGDLKTASSQDYPMQEVVAYDPDLLTETAAFQAHVTQNLM
jgi:hypothetical protein